MQSLSIILHHLAPTPIPHRFLPPNPIPIHDLVQEQQHDKRHPSPRHERDKTPPKTVLKRVPDGRLHGGREVIQALDRVDQLVRVRRGDGGGGRTRQCARGNKVREVGVDLCV